MIKPNDPKKLAIDIAFRSSCRIMMGAVIYDKRGIFSWGWNSSGFDGMGLCAERHAISRANPNRLNNSIICIAGFRRRNLGMVRGLPCELCESVISKVRIKTVIYLDKGEWKEIRLEKRQ